MSNKKDSKSNTRRNFIKSVGVVGGVASLPSLTRAAPDSEFEPRKPTKSERRKMEKGSAELAEKVRLDSEREYQKKHEAMESTTSGGLTTQTVISGSSVPSLGCSDSYGTQNANWVNSNESGPRQIGSWSNGYTETGGAINKAFAVSDAPALGDQWAWAETGVVFDTEDSGRLKCTCNGYIRGQNYLQYFGGNVGDAKLHFFLLGYNLTDGKAANGPTNGTRTIEKFGINALGLPKSKSRSYSDSLEIDVDANKRYLFVAKVYSTAWILSSGGGRAVSDADDKYNSASTPGGDFDGYHQMYDMGLSWNSCR